MYMAHTYIILKHNTCPVGFYVRAFVYLKSVRCDVKGKGVLFLRIALRAVHYAGCFDEYHAQYFSSFFLCVIFLRSFGNRSIYVLEEIHNVFDIRFKFFFAKENS